MAVISLLRAPISPVKSPEQDMPRIGFRRTRLTGEHEHACGVHCRIMPTGPGMNIGIFAGAVAGAAREFKSRGFQCERLREACPDREAVLIVPDLGEAIIMIGCRSPFQGA